MPIKTKRWDEPIQKNDGWRILVCRYRPRGLPKKGETWDVWFNELGPSPDLHDDKRGKYKKPITWLQFKKRYEAEMKEKASHHLILCLAHMVAQGETITLLCASSCLDESKCHRSILKRLILSAM